jgi:pantoate--beta-alanine ligase
LKTEVISTIGAMREQVRSRRNTGQTIGCVPTMGALHAGHIALIEAARAASDFVVVTIFVNPIQFDRKDDYEAYARSLPADLEICQAHKVDAVFAPSVDEMYPVPAGTFIDVPEVSKSLCGAFRPGHFRGVATVVAKLFNIVQPDLAYFGEKDAQQVAVIRKMVADLNMPVRVVPVPTVREPDGLALSSRNQRLSAEERSIAPMLYQALCAAQSEVAQGCLDSEVVKNRAQAVLATQPAVRVEYLEVVDPLTVQPVEKIEGAARIAIAAWVGSTRLIDNVLCTPGEGMVF